MLILKRGFFAFGWGDSFNVFDFQNLFGGNGFGKKEVVEGHANELAIDEKIKGLRVPIRSCCLDKIVDEGGRPNLVRLEWIAMEVGATLRGGLSLVMKRTWTLLEFSSSALVSISMSHSLS